MTRLKWLYFLGLLIVSVIAQGDIGPTPGPVMPAFSAGGVIQVGQLVWKIVEANEPVLTAQGMQQSVLPYGINSPLELSQWRGPAIRTFKQRYKNLYGMKTVQFEYMISASFAGTDGFGKYLANVSVVPTRVTVNWGYSLSASVTVGEATNVGTVEAPVAAIPVTVNWKIQTLLKHGDFSKQFIVKATGEINSVYL